MSKGLMQNNIEVTHLVSTAYKHHYAAGQLHRKVADLLQESRKNDQPMTIVRGYITYVCFEEERSTQKVLN
jgi:hypothetical protein